MFSKPSKKKKSCLSTTISLKKPLRQLEGAKQGADICLWVLADLSYVECVALYCDVFIKEHMTGVNYVIGPTPKNGQPYF